MLTRAEASALRGRTILEDGRTYRRQAEQPGVQSFSLGDLVRAVAQTLQQRFAACPGIRLDLEIPHNLPLLEGRATLASLPLSLLACSFWALAGAPEPRGTITVAVRDAPDGMLEMRITDTGESLQALVGHPDRVGGGHLFPHRGKHGGLYFFLAQEIVAEHSGVITVTDGTERGTGTTLVVRLPRKYTPPTLVDTDVDDLGNPP